MNWLILWLGIYLILLLLLTLRHSGRTGMGSYLLNNRNTGPLPLVATTLATFVGGGTSIGLMAMGYESGFAAVGIGVAYVIGFFILARFAPRINRLGRNRSIFSFPQFLNESYLSDAGESMKRWFSATVSGINIFIFFFLLSAQFVGMAALLRHFFEVSFLWAALISAAVVIVYTTVSGFRGVLITDMVQFMMIVVMILVIFLPGVITDTGGLTRLRELPPGFLNGTFYGWPFLVALPLFLAPSVLIRMDLWQRILAARDEKTARRVSIWSGLGMLPFYIIFPLVGMAVQLNGTLAEPKYVTWIFLEKHSTPFMLGFAVAGLLSALMSSGDSFLNLIAISAVRDFSGFRKGKESSAKNAGQQFKIRIATLLFGITALFLALLLPRIVDLMVVGIATIVIFVPATFFALTAENPSNFTRAAFFSIVSGFTVNLFFFVLGTLSPESFEPKSSFIPAFLTSLIVMIVMVKNRKNRIGRREIREPV
ncbi:MAG: sodium:solute symporter [Bacteroidales bacterium]